MLRTGRWKSRRGRTVCSGKRKCPPFERTSPANLLSKSYYYHESWIPEEKYKVETLKSFERMTALAAKPAYGLQNENTGSAYAVEDISTTRWWTPSTSMLLDQKHQNIPRSRGNCTRKGHDGIYYAVMQRLKILRHKVRDIKAGPL